MTSDQTFTVWIAALTALPTIGFTGWVAYWTWRRDQERIVVQKSPVHWKTLDGTQTEATLTGVGVVVTNFSLYPVRVAGIGFRVDGKTALALDRDGHDEKEWPPEVASHARMVVYANAKEWKQLDALGLRNRIDDSGFVAVARTQAGSLFASNRLSVRILRPLRAIRHWLKKKDR
jgi:hypothetical protein